MESFDFDDIESLPVYKDSSVPKHNDAGEKVIAWKLDGKIVVHPDHWNDFIEKMLEIASQLDNDND